MKNKRTFTSVHSFEKLAFLHKYTHSHLHHEDENEIKSYVLHESINMHMALQISLKSTNSSGSSRSRAELSHSMININIFKFFSLSIYTEVWDTSTYCCTQDGCNGSTLATISRFLLMLTTIILPLSSLVFINYV